VRCALRDFMRRPLLASLVALSVSGFPRQRT
jgi:hypothetical protein